MSGIPKRKGVGDREGIRVSTLLRAKDRGITKLASCVRDLEARKKRSVAEILSTITT